MTESETSALAPSENRVALASTAAAHDAIFRLIDSDLIGIVVADASRIFEANECFLKIVGYSRADLEAGRIIWPEITPLERDAVGKNALLELAEHGLCLPFDTEYFRKDGTRVPVRIGAATTQREPLRWVGYILDRSEQMRTEALVQQQAALLNLTHEPILVWEWNGPIVFWNAGAERLYGFSKAEAMGRVSDELLRTVFPQGRETLRETLAREGELVSELTHTTRSGHTVVVESYQQVTRDSSGRVLVLETNRDVTRRVRLYQAREEFFSAAAHDLRTPLTVIKGLAQIYEKRSLRLTNEEGQVQAGVFARIDDIVNDIVSQIDELLDVVQLQTGRHLSLNRAPVDLVDLVSKQIAKQAGAAGSHRADLQAEDEQIIGNWDTKRLERVVANLLSNAAKYSPPGSPITVAVRQASEDRPWAVLSVADRGIGIAEADLGHVFDRFYRGVNVGNIKGNGVGLAGVRQIVAQHGGAISVKSVLGAGSTFTVRLPLTPRQIAPGSY